MTNLDAGKRIIFLCIALSLSAKAFALERRAWVFEQLGTLPSATKPKQTRYQLVAESVSYYQAISNQVSAVLDLREFELGVKASQRFFGVFSAHGNAVRASLKEDQSTISAEIARYYVGERGIFGRMGVEFFQFFPSKDHWGRFSIATGMLPFSGGTWETLLATNLFLSLNGKGSHLLVRGETSSPLTKNSIFSLGGFLNWNYRLSDNTAIGQNEHMLFSFGPLLGAQTTIGKFGLRFPIRLWLDQEIYESDNTLLTAHASEFSLDALLSWTLLL